MKQSYLFYSIDSKAYKIFWQRVCFNFIVFILKNFLYFEIIRKETYKFFYYVFVWFDDNNCYITLSLLLLWRDCRKFSPIFANVGRYSKLFCKCCEYIFNQRSQRPWQRPTFLICKLSFQDYFDKHIFVIKNLIRERLREYDLEFTKIFLSDLPQRIFFCNKMPISLKVWRVMPKVCFVWSQALKNNDGIRISRGIYLQHCFPESATWYIRDTYTYIVWLILKIFD